MLHQMDAEDWATLQALVVGGEAIENHFGESYEHVASMRGVLKDLETPENNHLIEDTFEEEALKILGGDFETVNTVWNMLVVAKFLRDKYPEKAEYYNGFVEKFEAQLNVLSEEFSWENVRNSQLLGSLNFGLAIARAAKL